MKPKLISRDNLECHVATTDKTRLHMAVIRFEEHRTVSTDGNILLVVPYSDVPIEEFPVTSPSGFEDGDDKKVQAVSVPLPAIARVLKALPKNQTRPVLEHAVLHNVAKQRATFTTDDLDVRQDISTQLAEGKFPNYEQVFTEPGKEAVTLNLSVEILGKLLKALRKADGTTIRFRIDPKDTVNGEVDRGVAFTVGHGGAKGIFRFQDRGVHGVIMPIAARE